MQLIETRSADGTRLRIARSNTSASKQVLIVHGLGEHIGRYDWLQSELSEQGYGVSIVELRGHGESMGRRGHVQRWVRYQEDVMAALSVIGQPTVIVAHSMGGLIALSTLLEDLHPPVIGIVVSNPLLGLVTMPSTFRRLIGRILSRLLPFLYVPNEIDPMLVSRNVEHIESKHHDPLAVDRITIRWAREMLTTMETIQASASQLTQPMLMLLSEEDYVCDAHKAQRFASSYGGNISVKKYPKLYHELFHEPEKEAVCKDLMNWLSLQFIN